MTEMRNVRKSEQGIVIFCVFRYFVLFFMFAPCIYGGDICLSRWYSGCVFPHSPQGNINIDKMDVDFRFYEDNYDVICNYVYHNVGQENCVTIVVPMICSSLNVMEGIKYIYDREANAEIYLNNNRVNDFLTTYECKFINGDNKDTLLTSKDEIDRLFHKLLLGNSKIIQFEERVFFIVSKTFQSGEKLDFTVKYRADYGDCDGALEENYYYVSFVLSPFRPWQGKIADVSFTLRNSSKIWITKLPRILHGYEWWRTSEFDHIIRIQNFEPLEYEEWQTPLSNKYPPYADSEDATPNQEMEISEDVLGLCNIEQLNSYRDYIYNKAKKEKGIEEDLSVSELQETLTYYELNNIVRAKTYLSEASARGFSFLAKKSLIGNVNLAPTTNNDK